MRMLTGAILILAAEQAFAHSYLVGFPHQGYVSEVLIPTSLVLGAIGAGFLVWGTIKDQKGS